MEKYVFMLQQFIIARIPDLLRYLVIRDIRWLAKPKSISYSITI
jgi:hypothetical protein